MTIEVAARAMECALASKNLTKDIADSSDNRSIAAEVPGRPPLGINQLRTIGVQARASFRAESGPSRGTQIPLVTSALVACAQLRARKISC